MFVILLLVNTVLIFAVAFEGIPDSENKAYIYVKDGKTFLNTGTLPKMLPIRSANNVLLMHGYSEKIKSCQYFALKVKSTSGTGQFETIPAESDVFTAKFTYRCAASQVILPVSLAFTGANNAVVSLNCYDGYYYTLYNGFQHTCNFWLRLDTTNTIDQATPAYPAFTYPSKEEGYYLMLRAPKGFEERATKLVINVRNIENKTYTFYKMAGRPIPTFNVTAPPKCSNFEVFIEFDATCTISMEFLANDIKIANTTPENLGFRPKQIVFTFTYTGVYFYTFEPLSMRHLDKCVLPFNHETNAEFTMRIWHKEAKESKSCNSVEIVFIDDVAMKPPVITTTTTTEPPSTEATTDTTVLETETEEEKETASASAKVWTIVALLCFFY